MPLPAAAISLLKQGGIQRFRPIMGKTRTTRIESIAPLQGGMVAGLWEDELCIISADNRSWGDSTLLLSCGADRKTDTQHLFSSMGMRPYIEISPMKGGREGSQTDIQDVLNLSSVTEILPPVIKWTSRGEKPHWRVMVRDTTVVSRLRDQLRS